MHLIHLSPNVGFNAGWSHVFVIILPMVNNVPDESGCLCPSRHVTKPPEGLPRTPTTSYPTLEAMVEPKDGRTNGRKDVRRWQDEGRGRCEWNLRVTSQRHFVRATTDAHCDRWNYYSAQYLCLSVRLTQFRRCYLLVRFLYVCVDDCLSIHSRWFCWMFVFFRLLSQLFTPFLSSAIYSSIFLTLDLFDTMVTHISFRYPVLFLSVSDSISVP